MSAPRIYRVSYRSGVRRRVATFYAKVPYSGSYAMTETLTRLQSKNQILRFTVAVAKPGEITPEIRSKLQRWLPALEETTAITGVDINA